MTDMDDSDSDSGAGPARRGRLMTISELGEVLDGWRRVGTPEDTELWAVVHPDETADLELRSH